MYSAVILAGGAGRRMGFDKKELALNGEPLIDRLIALLRAEADEIIVSSNTPFERKGVITAGDTLGAGPLAGIFSALSVCSGAYLYVTACDMPFISRPYIQRLKDMMRSGGYDAAAARRRDGFIEPFNALYNTRIRAHVEELLRRGNYKMSSLLQRLNVSTLDDFSEREFFNINFPCDLRAACDLDNGAENRNND